MSRSDYRDWVPDEDQQRFFRIEQTVGELENNPTCREASSTLFWQAFFYLKKYHDQRGLETILEGATSVEDAKKAEILDLAEKAKGIIEGEWSNFDIQLLNRFHEVLNRLRDESPRLIRKSPDELVASAFVQLHLVTILLRAQRKGLWGSPELLDSLMDIGMKAFAALPQEDYSGVLISSRRFYRHLRDKGIDPETFLNQATGGTNSPTPPSQVIREAARKHCPISLRQWHYGRRRTLALVENWI